MTVWIPSGLRTRFVAEAAGLGVGINELAERFIEAGLLGDQRTPSPLIPDPKPESTGSSAVEYGQNPPLSGYFDPETADTPPVESAVDRDAAILAAHRLGLTPTEITRRLATMGILASSGNPISRRTVIRVLDSAGLKPNL
jgi:hypothetical protein